MGKNDEKKERKNYAIRDSQWLYQAQTLLRWSPLRGFSKSRPSESAKRYAPFPRRRSLARRGDEICSFMGRIDSTLWFKGNEVKPEGVLQISLSLHKWCWDRSGGYSTTNTIYMISSTSFPSISSAMEDPPDLFWHHLHDDGDICKTTFGFTPFHLNHSMESILPIRDQIPSPCLANYLCLGKGEHLFIESDAQLLENPHNGLYLKKFYAEHHQ